jgi:hypothetical protein
MCGCSPREVKTTVSDLVRRGRRRGRWSRRCLGRGIEIGQLEIEKARDGDGHRDFARDFRGGLCLFRRAL